MLYHTNDKLKMKRCPEVRNAGQEEAGKAVLGTAGTQVTVKAARRAGKRTRAAPDVVVGGMNNTINAPGFIIETVFINSV